MSPRIPVLVLLAIAPAVLRPQHPSQPPSDSYRALLARLQAKDTALDFTALRLAFANSAEYAPYGSRADAHWDSLGKALSRQDLRRALIEADSALAVDYLDVRTHVLRAYAAENLGDTSSARWDRIVAALLVRSIERSGVGTVDSPYVVISIREEYALLGMTGYQRDQQSLGDCGSRPCDILEAHNLRTGQKRTFCFDISLPKRALDRLFQSK